MSLRSDVQRLVDRATGIGSVSVSVDGLNRVLDADEASKHTLQVMLQLLRDHVQSAPDPKLRQGREPEVILYWTSLNEWCRTRDSLCNLIRIVNSHDVFDEFSSAQLYPDMEE